MSTERFNRQFILVDFRDLDNPDYLAFVRSPEFSTYLLMRRYIWRSRQAHHMGLEALYAQGHLACSLDRERMAERLGGLSTRTVSNDLAQLERRSVIAVQHTGRQNIYLLGRWGDDEGAYYETWYVDRLHVRQEELFSSEGNPPEALNREEETFPSEVHRPFPPDRQVVASMNREGKRERNREIFEDSKGPLIEVLEARRVLGSYIEDFAREFRDEAPLKSSVTRAMNLYVRSGLDLDGFIAVVMAARQRTKEHTASIRKPALSGDGFAAKNKMPYFFSVVLGLLGLEGGDDISLRPFRSSGDM